MIDFLVTNTEKDDTIVLGHNAMEKLRENKEDLEKIRQSFKKLFSEEPSEGYPGYECTIETKLGKSVYIKYRSISNALLRGTEKTISQLVKNGFIKPSQSSWAEPSNALLAMQNSKSSNYIKELKKLHKEKFEIGEKVLMKNSKMIRQNKQNPKFKQIKRRPNKIRYLEYRK